MTAPDSSSSAKADDPALVVKEAERWMPAFAGHDSPGVVIVRAGGRSSALGMSRSSAFWVYILASKIGGTLYIGVTNDLVRRVYEHRAGAAEGFTKKYGVHRLVYFEQFDDIENAIRREKRLKSWNRAWKIRLIEEGNPNWIDLYYQIAGAE